MQDNRPIGVFTGEPVILTPYWQRVVSRREIYKMKSPKILVSTRNGKTYMLTSYDPKTLVVFEDPEKKVDDNGNVVLYYSTIKIRKM